jgi:hypothetical protein
MFLGSLIILIYDGLECVDVRQESEIMGKKRRSLDGYHNVE